MVSDSNEINSVKYPVSFDTVQNWPATTQVTQDTGEDITRNRDALLILERLLGLNPHIGLFTANTKTATVAQRLSILEQGVSEGRFEFQKLKVKNAIETVEDVNQNLTLVLGAVKNASHNYTEVEFKGPVHILDSGKADPRVRMDVGFIIEKTQTSKKSTEAEIVGSSEPNKPLLTITDYNRSAISDSDHLAVKIDGNLHVTGYITGNFALDHSRLNGINTDPVIDALGNILVNAIHVSRGNFHSHKRGLYDSTLGRWRVDPNPTVATFGLIDHSDLEPTSTRTSIRQRNFVPEQNVAYHVTNGDDHDHVGGDGAQLRHNFLLGIDPNNSNHVSGGNTHTHDPSKKDGGLIPTNGVILETGLENSLSGIPIDSTTNPIVAKSTMSTLLDLISDRFVSIDTLNTTQNTRLDQHDSDIAQAQITKTEFNQVRSDVVSAVSQVETLDTTVENLSSTVDQNTEDISDLRSSVLAAIFSSTITSITAGTKVYGISGGGADSASLAIAANVDYTDVDDTGATLNKNATVNFTTNSISLSQATTAKNGSSIVPRAGILQNFVVRASDDLPANAEVSVTIWKNFEPTTLSLTLIHEDITGIPAAVVDSTGQVTVAQGDFLTFEVFNRGSVNVSNIAIAASVGYSAPVS